LDKIYRDLGKMKRKSQVTLEVDVSIIDDYFVLDPLSLEKLD